MGYSDRTIEPSEVTRPNIEITPPPLEVTKRTERAISEVMSTKPKALKCHKAKGTCKHVVNVFTKEHFNQKALKTFREEMRKLNLSMQPGLPDEYYD